MQNAYALSFGGSVAEGKNLSLSLWDGAVPVNETLPEGAGESSVAENACKMPKQDSDTVARLTHRGCSHPLTPTSRFYDFRSLFGRQREWS